MSDDWITTAEAAKISGYHPEHIRRLMRQHRIAGRKFGIVWQVYRQSLVSYMDEIKGKGERRGPKK